MAEDGVTVLADLGSAPAGKEFGCNHGHVVTFSQRLPDRSVIGVALGTHAQRVNVCHLPDEAFVQSRNAAAPPPFADGPAHLQPV